MSNDYVWLPRAELIEPVDGHADVWLNQFWFVNGPGGDLLWYRLYQGSEWLSPQCNLNETLMLSRLDEVRFSMTNELILVEQIDAVFRPHRCSDYS